MNKAYAQTPPASQSLRISPVILTIPLSPNKQYGYEVTLENISDKPIPLQANLNDFDTTGEEGEYNFPETQTNPLLSWISLSDKELILAPKEKKKIVVTVKTPSSVPVGGYYGMLFFQPLPQTEEQTTQVIPRIGILLLGSLDVPGDANQKAHIETFSTGLLHEVATLPLLLRVKNTSLHYFTAKPILTISPVLSLTNTETKPIYLTDRIIFQGKIRRWEEPISLQGLKPNIYKVHLALSVGNGEYVVAERYIVFFPFMKIAFGIIILGLLFVIIRWRKKLLKAIKILLFNN